MRSLKQLGNVAGVTRYIVVHISAVLLTYIAEKDGPDDVPDMQAQPEDWMSCLWRRQLRLCWHV